MAVDAVEEHHGLSPVPCFEPLGRGLRIDITGGRLGANSLRPLGRARLRDGLYNTRDVVKKWAQCRQTIQFCL